MTRPELPWPVVFLPLAGLLVLPALAGGGVAGHLVVLAAEILLGLPALLITPPALKPEVLPAAPWPGEGRGWIWPLLALLALAYQLAAAGLGALVPLPPEVEAALLEALRPASAFGWALVALTSVAVAPLMEEIYFRGVLPFVWRRHVGPRGALTFSALAFAFMHGNPWQLPQLFLLGLLLGFVRERTGSLLPGIVLHALINGFGLLAIALG